MDAKIFVIVLCLFLAAFSIGCAGKGTDGTTVVPESVPTDAPEPDLSTLAIYPFETAGQSNLTGIEAANLLISELMDIQHIRLVERRELERILNELGLEMSDLEDPSTRIEIGKLLGAQLLCFGSLNRKINLTTARIVQTETSEILFVSTSREKDAVKSVTEVALALKDELRNPTITAILEAPPQSQPDPTLTEVEVTGLGVLIDGDVISAKELALKDAYAKAIAQGAGVKLIRETQVENFQLVRDKILTQSVGYVASYEVLKEEPNPPSYEVAVRARVSRQPLSDVEKLNILVQYLHAKPRIVVLADGDAKGKRLPQSWINLIQGQISAELQKAGFLVVDAQTIEEKRTEVSQAMTDEDAARLGSRLKADVSIRCSFSASITDRVEQLNGKQLNFPIVTATTTGAFRVIHTDTADIIYAFSHEDVKRQRIRKGYGTTDEAAISHSLENFIAPSIDQLIWGLSARLGDPVQLRLELQNATVAQADGFEQQLLAMPEQIVLSSERLGFQEHTAHYQITTPSKKIFQKQIQSFAPADLGVDRIDLVRSEFGTIVLKIDDDMPPNESQTEDKTVKNQGADSADGVIESSVVVDSGANGSQSTTKDTTPPVIKITSIRIAEPPTAESGETVEVTGFAIDDRKIESVTINGEPVVLRGDKDLRLESTLRFNVSISVPNGQNTVRIVAMDASGNQTIKNVTIPSASSPVQAMAEGERTGKRWALLIGVNRYEENEQDDYYLPNLEACVNDVKALDAVLREPARSGFEHVMTLVSNDTPDETDDPTDRNILRELDALVAWTKLDDLVLIYFSGHGWQNAGEAYLLPQNFEFEFPDRTGIRSTDLSRKIEQMKARKVVTILDACHSGGIEFQPKGGKAGRTQLTLNKRYQEAFKTSAGKVVLHSCDANEKSWELADGSGGVFSKYLVDGLLGAADAQGDNNGVITIQEVYEYLYEQVIAHMRQDGRGTQTPVLSLSGKLIGEIPLTIHPERKANHDQQKKIDTVYTLIDDPIVASRAISLLDKRTNGESLTSDEAQLLKYLDNLLTGKIDLDIYLGADRRFGQ